MAGLEQVMSRRSHIFTVSGIISPPAPMILAPEVFSTEDMAIDADIENETLKAKTGADSAILVLGRGFDTCLRVPPNMLEYTIHNMIPDELKARSIVRKMIPQSKIIYDNMDKYGLNLMILNRFGFIDALDKYHPSGIAFFKLYEPKESYLSLDPIHRRPMMSLKNAVETSLVDFLPALLKKIKEKKYRTKIYIFETSDHPGLGEDDKRRKLLIEYPIIGELKKKYKGNPDVEFIEGKSLEAGVQTLARGHYKN
jgi:hypothetical protein